MKKLLSILVLLLTISITNDINAQPPNPGGGGGDVEPGCFPPPCVPIDGGLSWLLVAGVAYGGKKIYQFNKEKKEDI